MNYEIKKLTNKIKELPGISTKVAERLAIDLIENSKENQQILKEIVDFSSKLHIDELTGLIVSDSSKANENKEFDTILVLDSNKDIVNVINKTKTNKALFVLGLKSKNDYQNINLINIFIDKLKKTIDTYKSKEIMFFLSPTIEADIIIKVVKEEFKNSGYLNRVELTRLNMGIPFGGSIEFSDERTIKEAIKNRGKV